MNRKIVLLTSIAFLSFLAGHAVAEEIAPDFTLTDIDGIEFSLGSYRGRVVLLDFFATWCDPCVAQIPNLKSLRSEFGEGLVIISISVSPPTDTVGKLQQFRQEYEINWIIARDTVEISYEYDVQLIPTLVIIDQEGHIQHKHVGPTDESVLREEIYEIIPEFGILVTIMFVLLTLAVVVIHKRMKALSQRE